MFGIYVNTSGSLNTMKEIVDKVSRVVLCMCFFFQAEDGIRDLTVTGVQTCALPISNDVRQGRIEPDAIDESLLEGYLSTHGLPDPDLLIRTSGETRISNFLLWQLADRKSVV